jgi:hypothetical protein
MSTEFEQAFAFNPVNPVQSFLAFGFDHVNPVRGFRKT